MVTMDTLPDERPSSPLVPEALTVVYDDRCQLCQRCRAWLTRSSQLVPISFVAASDLPGVRRLGLEPAALPVGDDLIVVGHTAPGHAEPIWIGPDAFITCLWALTEHRELSARLQRPALRPVAKRAFHALSLGRGSVSKLLDVTGSAVLASTDCTSATCAPADRS